MAIVDPKTKVQQIISESCEIAKQFVTQFFYPSMDRDRLQLNTTFREISQVVWNGNPYPNPEVQRIQDFFIALPPSKHVIHSIDSQPIFIHGFDFQSMLVSVSGTVQFSDDPVKAFHTTFILSKDPDRNYYVLSEVFRTMDP
ncbi:putative NTF2-related export protein 1/2 [Monocercomonoides exilis]|uniref:putative NTF2-related export protein 1/2 n=1 Tax=Monocercomonoides exilis TaxID=2049356 RepID=UPI00355AB9FB|nr:putative NTF2-related export protein 1/2 [Monocercomonoides exilis]|eukprot:MONOS_8469.1-p1 / transcript=MONOS_8469.1 / gene=MONOS_8469 / organism=Monocercomonoides_exilis_PA203 / gene_product=unspecified product / transcript_product=unspecified product / location=Mono_scaffold00320:30714-31368(+) / protein_length=141 / sequence_SO=supercontig / SO=protein_coding / is_pseudo=false